MSSEITPLFIFSLPRSGSTLLQRIIGASDKVQTLSEPWLLLPILGSYSEVNIYAEYGHSLYRKAFKDLMQSYPGGLNSYRKRINDFIVHVYSDLARDEAKYFLDKTPRYHLICDEIIEIFPEARFIFLWRNPEDVVQSIANTWYNGDWVTHPFEVDLFKGLKKLSQSYKNQAGNSNVLSMRYEDLTNPDSSEKEVQRLRDFLDINDISFDDQITLDGALGDKPVSKEKREQRKKNIINTMYRKTFLKQIIDNLSYEDWDLIGYDKESLTEGINAKKTFLPISFSDIISIVKVRFRKKIIWRSDDILY